MDPTRAACRFGWDGDHSPLAGVVLVADPDAVEPGRRVVLGFPSDVDALTWCDWWGSAGAAAFAAYRGRHRFRL